MSREADRLARLLELFGAPAEGAGVTLGIGDDAAVLEGHDPGGSLVWTVDAQVEDVHFRRAWLSFEDLGYRSLVAAASDVSAMGGAPWCALSALVLTAQTSDAELEALASGQYAAATAVGASVVGGNLARGSEVSVTTTVLGRAARPVARAGARPGDGVWMAGRAGLAGAGLRALIQGVSDGRVDAAVDAWRRPTPLIDEGRALGKVARAAIDVSDGVGIDASRLADASGVCVVLDRDALIAQGGEGLSRAAEAVSHASIDLVLGGGEDYALLAASNVAIHGFVRIGEVREGSGVVLRDARGESRLEEPAGFDHFG